MATNLARLNAAESVIKTMIANGIDTLYCLPGVQNDDFFDALHRVGGAIAADPRRATSRRPPTWPWAPQWRPASRRPIAWCRARASSTRRRALATAQSLNARRCSPSPARSSRHRIGKGLGFLHEIPDQLGIMKTLTKWAAHIDGPEDAGAKTREAFRQLVSGVPGPVGIECGWDIWKRAAEVAFDAEPSRRETPAIDEDAIEAAAKLLAGSKRPADLGRRRRPRGHGRGQASWPRCWKRPCHAFRTGAGVLDNRHDLSQRVTGGYRLWKDVDVVLGVGTRLHQQLDWGTDDAMKIIHLDIDPTRLGRIRKPDVGIVADALEGLRALLKRLPRHLGKRASRRDEMAAMPRPTSTRNWSRSRRRRPGSMRSAPRCPRTASWSRS